MKMSSVAELNALQMAFNKNLRVFMKSLSGDASKLVGQYQQLKQLRSSLLLELQDKNLAVPETFDYKRLKNLSPAYGVVKLMREKVFPIRDFVRTFIIHGSYATQDFIPDWSDLDTMIILKDQTFDSADNLIKVKKVFLKVGILCYWIDPLAHHQLSFVTEFDLGYYPQAFLPLSSYENGLLLLGQGDLCFRLRDDEPERQIMFERFKNHFWHKIEKQEWSQNKYDWKNDLAHVFLLPSLVLQTKGIYVYKRDSFLESRQFFTDLENDLLQKATNIMREWRVANFVRYLPASFVLGLPQRLSRIIVKAFRLPSLRSSPDEGPAEIAEFTKKFYSLYERQR